MTTNGIGTGVAKLLLAAAGIVGLVYLGVRLGNIESAVATNQRELLEHRQAVVTEHHEMEERTDDKVAAAHALIFAELRAIDKRLERIERKLP